MARTKPPIALTIAGSDSGGGAGIQADLKTFEAFRVFGTSAITAITAQNTEGVQAVEAVSLSMVRAQIDSVVDDLRPAAFKSGMLATEGLVNAVADAIEDHRLTGYVLDPVMVATSGDRLLDEDAVEAVSQRLLPLATLITPNLHEAGILLGRPIESVEAMSTAAMELVGMGASAALVKGGHLDSDRAVDLLFDGSRETVWERDRIRTRHTHGTGCTLSAACAAGLALGHDLPEAVDAAVDFVTRAIAGGPGLGSGSGPVDHGVTPRFADEAGGGSLP